MKKALLRTGFSLILLSASLFLSSTVHAAVGDIGHWQDSAGGQLPTTSFAAFQFASQQRNDGSYTKPDSSTIELDEAGHFLIISTIKGVDTSNARDNHQSKIVLTSGTGTLFTSHYTGYSRDNSENYYWTRAVGVLINGSTNAQVQVQYRGDTDLPTGGSTANESDVQVVRINPDNWGIYAFGATTGAMGGTTPNTADITAVTLESSTAAIEGNTTTETVTVKGDNKRYLVAWSISGTTGGSRTQRIGHLEYGGTDDLATQSYCYQRNAANEYCGLGSMDLIETSTADIAIQAEVYRGPGVAADQGGADIDGSFDLDGLGQMVVLELPDTLEVFRSHDATGLQDITASATLNAMRTVDFNDSASFTQSSVSAMDVTAAADVFNWANVWTARNNVSSGSRQTSYGHITVNGVEQSVGRHGNYSRGNQSTTDTFAMSVHPAGIFAVGTAGHDIGVNTDPLAGGEAGGTDRTQAGSVGFFALNLDTLVSASPTYTQNDFEWFVTADSVTLSNAWPPGGGENLAENAALTQVPSTNEPLESGDQIRMQMNFTVSGATLAATTQAFKLWYDAAEDCTAASGWTAVGAKASGSIWRLFDEASVGDSTTQVNNISTSTASAEGYYSEINVSGTNPNEILVTENSEWDWPIENNGAVANTSYCFRMTLSDDTAFDTYNSDSYPKLTTAPSAGNFLRHGNIFQNETEQGFFW